jgi:lectin-like protein/dockerin type I repeat protein
VRRHSYAALALLTSAALAPVLVPVPAPAQFISPPVTNPANGHQYQLGTQTFWAHSEMDAVKAGGHLVTINDAAEQNFVFSTFGSYGGRARLLWIGLNDDAVEGQYRWVSGQTPAYTNWAAGEPNNGGNEDFVAMYYPGHNAGGRWNDWGSRVSDPIGIPFHGVVEFDPAARPGPVLAETDSSWRVIAPAGNLEGQPIDNVGQAWEARNPGWNTNLRFDTSSWENARQIGSAVWGQDADTPLYLRKTFPSTGAGRDVKMLMVVDDDALVYLNGNLVIDDADKAGPTDRGPLDVSRFVVPGENLVAIKAHDSVDAFEGIRLMLYGSVAPGIDGDANLDGFVNGADFALLAGNFGKTGQSWGTGDFTGDGAVTGTDFALLAGNFGRSAPPGWVADEQGLLSASAATVPEPSALWTLAVATPLLRRRRLAPLLPPR